MLARVALGLAACTCACGRVGFGGGSATAEHNVAFVTSTKQVPAMFGSDLSGADASCNARAQAVGLASHYVALVTTSNMAAPLRLNGSRGWVRIDGAPVVDLPEQLTTDDAFGPVSLDENGALISDHVVTGAFASGTPVSGETCADYTSGSGVSRTGNSAANGGGLFSDGATLPCNVGARIYCFGVGKTVPLVIAPATGPRAFVTVGKFMPSAGIAAADALCSQEAAGAHLPGMFVALLPTQTMPAIDRLAPSPSQAPWVRLDGVPLAASVLDFEQGRLNVPLNVASSGAYVSSVVITGAVSPVDVAGSAADCADWTNSMGTYGKGAADSTVEAFNAGGAAVSCSTAASIYCLQK